MELGTVIPAEFLSRPNRFIARVRIENRVETVHVKNTGRCKELLIPGVTVYLQPSGNPLRKTKYDLIAVNKLRPGRPELLINMDSQVPNDAAEEWLRAGHVVPAGATVKRETTFGKSRFDFYLEDPASGRKIFLEVKGVTLERDGIAQFPDAPTERGVKHLNELAECVRNGFECWILFVIQMKEVRVFRPNEATHPEFADALRNAAAAGVHIRAVDCIVTPSSIRIDRDVPVELN